MIGNQDHLGRELGTVSAEARKRNNAAQDCRHKRVLDEIREIVRDVPGGTPHMNRIKQLVNQDDLSPQAEWPELNR